MNINQWFSKLRAALGLKMSYGIRAFAIYVLILGGLGWFILEHAVERLNDGMRQSAENVMVDSVNILASLIEAQTAQHSQIQTNLLEQILKSSKSRELKAKIYQVDKTLVGAEVYVTNQAGMVIYDSTGRDEGKDYSSWRDVYLTLSGQYGARTSFVSQSTEQAETDPKMMVVAAPINIDQKIAGAISLAVPIDSLNSHLATESRQLKHTLYLALTVAIVIGFLLSVFFSRSMAKIATFADKMANGDSVGRPKFLDQRLSDLSASVENLRRQLDGKRYVESYIHGLTHELKTPITSIRGATELLNEGLAPEDQKRFLKNINRSNQRMALLVDRMLGLAKLENQTELIDPKQYELSDLINEVVSQFDHSANSKHINLICKPTKPCQAMGDPELIYQAISNLVDNAIKFADPNSDIHIEYGRAENYIQLKIWNQGNHIPNYALPRVFERFFSLPSNGLDGVSSKSTGLGLGFVKQVMKLHQGQASLENRENGVQALLKWRHEIS